MNAARPASARVAYDRSRVQLRGAHVAEIAVIRNISPATTSKHVRNLLQKFGVEHRQDAAVQVVREIIFRPDRWPEEETVRPELPLVN